MIESTGCSGRKLEKWEMAKSAKGKEDDSDKEARCILVHRGKEEMARGYLIDYGAGRVFFVPAVQSTNHFRAD